MVSLNVLDRLTRQVLGPSLNDLGNFEFRRGVYSSQLQNGIVRLVVVDPDKKNNRTFRTFLGLNSTTISDLPPLEMGAYLVRYVTRGGLSENPQNWPCHSETAAEESMEKIAGTVSANARSWFETYASPGALAAALGDEYDFLKGKLFLADGEKVLARTYLEKYRNRLLRMVMDDEVREALATVQGLLETCSTFEG